MRFPRSWLLVLGFATGALAALGLWRSLELGTTASPSIPAARTAPLDPLGAEAHPLRGAEGTTPRLARTATQDPTLRSIRGRVLTPSGDACAGALVGELGALEPAVSDADGNFELAVERAREDLRLLVLSEGHAPAHFERTVATESDELLELSLPRGAAIRGRVVDTRSQPLRDIELRLEPAMPGSWLLAIELEGVLPATRSTEDGAFLLERVPAGDYVLHARGERRLQRSSSFAIGEGETKDLAPLVLSREQTLRGRARDQSGSALAGVLVRGGGGTPGRDVSATATSGEDGSFHLAPLPEETLWLDAWKEGFARASITNLDGATSGAIEIELLPGARLVGRVLDASTEQPIERFALALRKLGAEGEKREGEPATQLASRALALREEAQRSEDPRAQQRLRELAEELLARQRQVEERHRERPIAFGGAARAIEDPEGRFELTGLDGGRYVLTASARGYAPAESEHLALRAGGSAVLVELRLRPAPELRGRVVAKADGAPIAGARIELLRALEVEEASQRIQRSLYGWIFATKQPRSLLVGATESAGDGSFAFGGVEGAQLRIAVRGDAIAELESESFDADRLPDNLVLRVGARATLTGVVRELAELPTSAVLVLLIGSQGTMRTAIPGADGSFRFERLPPGGYLARAFPVEPEVHRQRFFRALFPLHAGAVERAEVPPPDVVLGEGDTQHLELRLEIPPSGIVAGTLTQNGQPARGARATLRPLDAPDAGGVSVSASVDSLGRFVLANVAVGTYTLELAGPSRQVLHAEELRVTAGEVLELARELASGALRGSVSATGAAPADLRGTLWVLPGAQAVPEDLQAHRRTERSYRVRIRDGVFQDSALGVGPALAVVDIPGWKRWARPISIPAGAELELRIELGERER